MGNKFSWRVMLRNKDAYIKFRFSHPEAEAWLNEHPSLSPKLAADQVAMMTKHPWMILQYARELDRVLSENSMPDTKITVISVVALNDRPYGVMIDPTVDLTEVDYPLWGVPDWIVPLGANPSGESRVITRAGRRDAIVQALKRHAVFRDDQGFYEEIMREVNVGRASAALPHEEPGRLIISD